MPTLVEIETHILSAANLPSVAVAVRDGVEQSLADRYRYASWLAEQLDQLNMECQCAVCAGASPSGARCVAAIQSEIADAARDTMRDAWLESDEPRDWECSDDGASWTVIARPSEISEQLLDAVDDYDRENPREPLRYDLRARALDPVSGEPLRQDQVRESGWLDGEEPECSSDDGHDWQAPYSLLGGLRENPGVWGSGPGVTSRRVCGHCGAYEIHESARQDPGTGEFGSVTSYADADDESLAWIEQRAGNGD